MLLSYPSYNFKISFWVPHNFHDNSPYISLMSSGIVWISRSYGFVKAAEDLQDSLAPLLGSVGFYDAKI